MIKLIEPVWIFAIDTNLYSGNFERQMTAFLTGQAEEYGSGRKEANRFHQEVAGDPFASIIAQVEDQGVSTPCAIWPTPGWFNNGMGGFFLDGQEEAARASRDEDIRAQALEKIKVVEDMRVKTLRGEPVGEWTTRLCDRELRITQEDTERTLQQPFEKHAAYLSVAIFFKEAPSQKMQALMEERARQFAKELAEYKGASGLQNLTITGFRVFHYADEVKTQLQQFLDDNTPAQLRAELNKGHRPFLQTLQEAPEFVQYQHHGKMVWVRSSLQGQHWQHCLCRNCAKFKPDDTGNCPIAQALYANCVKFNVVTPVFECPEFTAKS
jgi:hypothetical protein